jgi:hypothetical protein
MYLKVHNNRFFRYQWLLLLLIPSCYSNQINAAQLITLQKNKQAVLELKGTEIPDAIRSDIPLKSNIRPTQPVPITAKSLFNDTFQKLNQVPTLTYEQSVFANDAISGRIWYLFLFPFHDFW